MSKIDGGYVYKFNDFWYYEVRYGFTPDGYQVIKRHVVHEDVVEVLASGLTKETAEGYIKLLKEE